MTGDRLVVLEISRMEAGYLAGLVTQFVELLDATNTDAAGPDPAVARLFPDAYPDDPDASREFRQITESDLLARRDADARTLLASLETHGPLPEPDAADDDDLTDMLTVALGPAALQSWLRTLAALRLVLATRLGIHSEDDHDESDPRFGIYDWLGFRLDGLVRAAED